MVKAFSKFKITNDIRKLLLGDTQIKSLVNNKIYPIVAPDGTTGDFIIYYRDAYGKDYTNFGVVNENCRVFIACISESYDNSINLIEKINDTIEGKHKNSNNYEYECRLIDSTEDFEDKKYIQILLFQIN